MNAEQASESYTNSAYSAVDRFHGPVFIKIFDYRFEPNHVFSEIDAIEMARGAGLRVPVCIYFGSVQVEDVDVGYIVSKSLDGVPLIESPRMVTKEYVDLVIEQIESLHTLEGGQFGPITPKDTAYIEYNRYREFISDVFEYTVRKSRSRHEGLPEELVKVHSRAIEHADAVKSFVLSHKDLNLKHIFIDDAEGIGFIDWEWALYLDPAYDYGVLLASLFSDSTPSDIFMHAFRACHGLPGINPEMLRLHLGRELVFSGVFQHRQQLLSDTQFRSRIESGFNLIRQVSH